MNKALLASFIHAECLIPRCSAARLLINAESLMIRMWSVKLGMSALKAAEAALSALMPDNAYQAAFSPVIFSPRALAQYSTKQAVYGMSLYFFVPFKIGKIMLPQPTEITPTIAYKGPSMSD